MQTEDLLIIITLIDDIKMSPKNGESRPVYRHSSEQKPHLAHVFFQSLSAFVGEAFVSKAEKLLRRERQGGDFGVKALQRVVKFAEF